VKAVTVSTLPVLRENEFSFTGGASGSVAGGWAAAGAGVGGGGTGGGGGGGAAAGGGESRLLLFVRTDLPGQISVMDDLDNTALPYFTLGKNYCATVFHLRRENRTTSLHACAHWWAVFTLSSIPKTRTRAHAHVLPGVWSPVLFNNNNNNHLFFIALLKSPEVHCVVWFQWKLYCCLYRRHDVQPILLV